MREKLFEYVEGVSTPAHPGRGADSAISFRVATFQTNAGGAF